jgi:hypothetical protein
MGGESVICLRIFSFFYLKICSCPYLTTCTSGLLEIRRLSVHYEKVLSADEFLPNR